MNVLPFNSQLNNLITAIILYIHIYCFYLFFSSLNTPPGTKVKLLGTVQVKNGLLLLDDSNISVLGGEVDHMVEKWELQRVRGDFVMMTQLLLIINVEII